MYEIEICSETEMVSLKSRDDCKINTTLHLLVGLYEI